MWTKKSISNKSYVQTYYKSMGQDVTLDKNILKGSKVFELNTKYSGFKRLLLNWAIWNIYRLPQKFKTNNFFTLSKNWSFLMQKETLCTDSFQVIQGSSQYVIFHQRNTFLGKVLRKFTGMNNRLEAFIEKMPLVKIACMFADALQAFEHSFSLKS